MGWPVQTNGVRIMLYLNEQQKKRICDTLKLAECDIGLFCEAVAKVGKEVDFQNDCCDTEDMKVIAACVEELKEQRAKDQA